MPIIYSTIIVIIIVQLFRVERFFFFFYLSSNRKYKKPILIIIYLTRSTKKHPCKLVLLFLGFFITSHETCQKRAGRSRVRLKIMTASFLRSAQIIFIAGGSPL